jgi:hypothetical protein
LAKINRPFPRTSAIPIEPSLREQLVQKRALFRKHPLLSR